MNKEDLMKQLCDDVFGLQQSPLYQYRVENNYQPVIGAGPLDSQIVFIGEAPGKNEALTGQPFCGAAGKLLDKLLLHASLKRSDVYITNIVKDRPPENRDPTVQELALYGPILLRQLEILRPKVIATLGRFSMKFLLEQFGDEHATLPISSLHGQPFICRTSFGNVHFVPLFHPAAALYNPRKREVLMEDMRQVASAAGKLM